jgi:hypothetical protein
LGNIDLQQLFAELHQADKLSFEALYKCFGDECQGDEPN